MLEDLSGAVRRTVGADKAYDTRPGVPIATPSAELVVSVEAEHASRRTDCMHIAGMFARKSHAN